MVPRILFVYANPELQRIAVPPFGIECLLAAIRDSGLPLQVRVCSPFLHPRPSLALRRAVEGFEPTIVAISLRNLDDGMVLQAVPEGPDAPPMQARFLLGDVRRTLQRGLAGWRGVGVVGGAGLGAAPWQVLDFLGQRFGVVGPGEGVMMRWLRQAVAGADPVEVLADMAVAQPGVVLDREAPDRALPAPRWELPWPTATVRSGDFLALALAYGWDVPLRVAHGCNRGCSFCVEAMAAGHRVRSRPVEAVVHEARLLAGRGVRSFWLTCSELNVPDNAHALRLCRALGAARLHGVRVGAYLQPAGVDDELLDALEGAGVALERINWEFGHLDPELLGQSAGPATRPAIDNLVELYQRRGLPRVCGSLLLGQPGETERSLDRALTALAEIDSCFAEGVHVACSFGVRVYPNSPLGRRAATPVGWAELRPHLYGHRRRDMLRPLAYCAPLPPPALARAVAQASAGLRGGLQPMAGVLPADGPDLAARRHLFLGDLALLSGAVGAARRRFRSGLALAPDDPDLLYALGASLLEPPVRPTAAVPLLERALAQVRRRAAVAQDDVVLLRSVLASARGQAAGQRPADVPAARRRRLRSAP